MATISVIEKEPTRICGGPSEVQKATPEVQKICDEVKPCVEEKAGKKFAVFKATSFTTQLVSGTNYFIKVNVGGNEYVHIRVYKPLPQTGKKLQLHGIQTSKTQQDQIAYF